MKIKKKYMILAIVIIVVLGIIFYHNLERRYEPQGEALDIFEENYTGCSGYTQQEKGSFVVNGDDPQLYLRGTNGQSIGYGVIGGLELQFASYSGQARNSLPIQVFYAKEGEGYTEKHSIKTAVYKGIYKGRITCLIPLPIGEYTMLRLDIDGDFQLQNIIAYTGEMQSHLYVSHRTVQNCLLYFPVAIIGCCLIFWAHCVRMRENRAGFKAYAMTVLFGTRPNKGREVHLDYLRILAAVLVILAHACSPMVELAEQEWKQLLLIGGLSLGLCCNVIYVMLSGTLLLSPKTSKEESVASFYSKRASRVIIPLAAYYLLLLSLNHEVRFLPPEHLGSALKRVVTGAPDAAPHLWLIYTIVALYLAAPFFRIMMQHLSDKMLFSLAVMILALNILTTYLPLFGMAFGPVSFLAGWDGVFLIGYILTRHNEKRGYDKRSRLIMAAAVISYIAMIVIVFIDTGYMNYVYNNAPTMIFTSCGIFIFFLKRKNWFANKSNFVMRLFSKYSYSIILIHWYVLFVIVQGKLHITALRFGCIGGIAATVVLTFLICLFLAVIFDNTVVIVCNVLFDKAVKAAKRITSTE